jgi:hypothetical protein
MIFGYVFEILVLLAFIWVFANIIRALVDMVGNGNGFWSLYHYLIREKEEKKNNVRLLHRRLRSKFPG